MSPGASRDIFEIGEGKSDIWLGGFNELVGGLLSHWDGTSWSPVDYTDGVGISRLWEVASDNVWVITVQALGGAWEYLHFDGKTWTDLVMQPSSDTWMFNGAEPDVAHDSFAFNPGPPRPRSSGGG